MSDFIFPLVLASCGAVELNLALMISGDGILSGQSYQYRKTL